MHEQKMILGSLFEHCIGKHIHSKPVGEEVYRRMKEVYKISIPKGKCAKNSTKVAVGDYRQPLSLQEKEDEKLLLCFGKLVHYVAPPGVGDNDNFHLDVTRALHSFKNWKGAVHRPLSGAWPTDDELKQKEKEVREAATEMFNNVKQATKKVIPCVHDALHTDAYNKN
jgi:hypothetical protein